LHRKRSIWCDRHQLDEGALFVLGRLHEPSIASATDLERAAPSPPSISASLSQRHKPAFAKRTKTPPDEHQTPLGLARFQPIRRRFFLCYRRLEVTFVSRSDSKIRATPFPTSISSRSFTSILQLAAWRNLTRSPI